jgi:hypothetical protein
MIGLKLAVHCRVIWQEELVWPVNVAGGTSVQLKVWDPTVISSYLDTSLVKSSSSVCLNSSIVTSIFSSGTLVQRRSEYSQPKCGGNLRGC